MWPFKKRERLTLNLEGGCDAGETSEWCADVEESVSAEAIGSPSRPQKISNCCLPAGHPGDCLYRGTADADLLLQQEAELRIAADPDKEARARMISASRSACVPVLKPAPSIQDALDDTVDQIAALKSALAEKTAALAAAEANIAVINRQYSDAVHAERESKRLADSREAQRNILQHRLDDRDRDVSAILSRCGKTYDSFDSSDEWAPWIIAHGLPKLLAAERRRARRKK